ncbi:MAG: hypothetical protein ACRYF2_01805, partial [Janthinobacterium lividum]
YLSLGASGAITITFSTAQISLALLWGSIDTSNLLTLSNRDTVRGLLVQATAANFFSRVRAAAPMSRLPTPSPL